MDYEHVGFWIVIAIAFIVLIIISNRNVEENNIHEKTSDILDQIEEARENFPDVGLLYISNNKIKPYMIEEIEAKGYTVDYNWVDHKPVCRVISW